MGCCISHRERESLPEGTYRAHIDATHVRGSLDWGQLVLPGKALRHVGGMPLLERVIRRARLLPWPVFLVTTDRAADDPLVALATGLGVASFRGSADRVLGRAVLAAEIFGLDAFIRLCGDRPLFPLDELRQAADTMRAGEPPGSARPPDLVTNCLDRRRPRGLTTEVVRTCSLRRILEQEVSAAQQEHLTLYFYEHPGEFQIVDLPPSPESFVCPGFAVDTESDVALLDRILTACPALDLSPAEADRIHAS